MNNKKNKKQRGGFSDDPMMMSMMIGLLVLVTLVCIYGGLVYFGGMDVNPMNWFNSESNLTKSKDPLYSFGYLIILVLVNLSLFVRGII